MCLLTDFREKIMHRNSESRLNFILILALVFYCGSLLFSNTYLFSHLSSAGISLEIIMKIMRYVAYGLCVVKMIIQQYYKRDFVLCLLMVTVLVLLVSLKGTDKAPIFQLLLIVSAYKSDFTVVLRTFLTLQCIFLFFAIFCYYLDIGSEMILDNGRMRSFLGFGWCNRGAYLWLGILVELFCVRVLKKYKVIWFMSVLLTIYIYWKTRTSFPFAAAMAILIFSALEWFEQIHVLGKKVLSCKVVDLIFVPAFACCSIFLCKMYSPGIGILNRIDLLTNRRLMMGKMAIYKYGLGPWGHDTSWLGSGTMYWNNNGKTGYEYVDCGYLQLAIDYGLIFLLIVVMIYEIGVYRAYKAGNLRILFAILIWTALSVFEPRLIDFMCNPFVYAGVAILSNSEVRMHKNLRCTDG